MCAGQSVQIVKRLRVCLDILFPSPQLCGNTSSWGGTEADGAQKQAEADQTGQVSQLLLLLREGQGGDTPALARGLERSGLRGCPRFASRPPLGVLTLQFSRFEKPPECFAHSAEDASAE